MIRKRINWILKFLMLLLYFCVLSHLTFPQSVINVTFLYCFNMTLKNQLTKKTEFIAPSFLRVNDEMYI